MKRLMIEWKRLVEGGETCSRCGDTGEEVRKAATTLRQTLAPLHIEVELEEVEITLADFKKQPLESNRIFINGRSLEEWLDGKTGQSPCCGVCGPNDCRTLVINGRSYEEIPADLITRAGLLAAGSLA